MIACAQRWRKRTDFLPKLSLRPARKERETTDGSPKTRSESSQVPWGWPTARESQGERNALLMITLLNIAIPISRPDRVYKAATSAASAKAAFAQFQQYHACIRLSLNFS
jgi:hypothetical protein